MNDKFLGMVGMARRAGKASLGSDKCVGAVKKGMAKLVIIAADASEGTKKSVTDSCRYYNVKYIAAASRAELGKYTGAASCAAVSINDLNFAKAILDKLV